MPSIDTTIPHFSEFESVLIIRENPVSVLNQLTSLHSILNYRLTPQPVKMIRDAYFDNSQGFLQKKRVNLRIRETNGTVLISVKSGTKMTRVGGIKRKETELPWSDSNLAKIAKELKLEHFPTRHTHQSSHLRPMEALGQLGIQIIQERQTRREARHITSETDPTHRVIAELAIDHVTYHFRDQDVSIQEVEVEARDKNSWSTVRDVTEKLLSTYQPALQRWVHGKFVTGKAIETLLRAGTLQSLLSETGLTPAGFDTLDRLIRSERS